MILNLTQRPATPEQLAAGVVDPSEETAFIIKYLLTFDILPTKQALLDRAKALAQVAKSTGCKRVMIGGAPFFMAPLEAALIRRNIEPVYAFSVRESVETTQPDGSVQKASVFKHLGFVPSADWEPLKRR